MSDITVPNLDHNPEYNREGGQVINQGSAEQIAKAKFEQFPHSKWAFGNPGNPYVFRRWPATMFRAYSRNGKTMCMEPEPKPFEFQAERNYIHAMDSAREFTASCQKLVHSQEEWAKAMDDLWRDSPGDAVAAFEARANERSLQIAHRNHDDRNLSPLAQAEITAQEDEAGVPLAEVKRKPGRPKKVV